MDRIKHIAMSRDIVLFVFFIVISPFLILDASGDEKFPAGPC